MEVLYNIVPKRRRMPRVDNEKFYSSAIEKHGLSAKGLNWFSKEYQELRFRALLEILPKDLSSYTVADAGCGFGDLYLYMQKKKRTPKNYIGLDSLVTMYEVASSRTGCEIQIVDVCKDKLPRADIYICSGAMNTLSPFETTQFIHNCYNSANYGFYFNVLHGDLQSETYNYLTTEQIEAFAKELQVERIEYVRDYVENDITVAFIKKSL
jgi:SAM-dependent methyltransferase